MNGSMMDQRLLISSLLTHAERHHGEQEIVSRRVEGDMHRYTFRDLGARWMVPMHYGTFRLSHEPIEEPVEFLDREAERRAQGRR